MSKTRIGLVFSHRPKNVSTWPRMGFDYQGRREELTKMLEQACPWADFKTRVAKDTNEGKKVLGELKKEGVDGFVVYMLGIWTGLGGNGKFPVDLTSGTVKNSVGSVIARSGYPTILVDDLYGGSGEFLLSLAVANREDLPVVGVASSDFQDIIKKIELLRVIKSLKESRIVLVSDGYYELWTDIDDVRDTFGTEVIKISTEEFNKYYSQIQKKDAEYWADLWSDNALRVEEPSEEEILKAARMYLALKEIIREKKADAITVDCFNTVLANKIPAYPCLPFFQLNNEGSTGICEGDIDSTLTQLMVRYLNGRPGFVNDPVVDTAKNQVIYAHCSCVNRVYGPKGKPNPYIIRDHAEDGKGAAVQSILPTGDIVTTAKVNTSEKAMAIHQGKAVENVDVEKACRSKLAVEAEAKTIMNNWNVDVDFKWHRVTFFGDIREPLKDLARLLSLKVVEEDL